MRRLVLATSVLLLSAAICFVFLAKANAMPNCRAPEVEYGNGCSSTPEAIQDHQRHQALAAKYPSIKGCVTPADWSQPGGRCMYVTREGMSGSHVSTRGHCFADAFDLMYLSDNKPPFDFLWFKTSEFDAYIGATPYGWGC